MTEPIINNVESEELYTDEVQDEAVGVTVADVTEVDADPDEGYAPTEEDINGDSSSNDDTEDDYINGVTSSTDEGDYINGITSSTASGPPSPSGEGNDLRELQNQFPALRGIESITELRHPEEYLRFRSLGLTPREALLATGEHPTDTPRAPRVTSPIAVRTRGERIPDYYLKMAREIFGNLSDREIQALYKKVK